MPGIRYECLAMRRQDVVAHYVNTGGWSPTEVVAIFNDWFRIPPALRAAAGDHDSAPYSTLLDYATAKGCVDKTVTYATTIQGDTGDRTTTAPPPATPPGPPPFSISNVLESFFGTEKNGFVQVGAIAIGGFILYTLVKRAGGD